MFLFLFYFHLAMIKNVEVGIWAFTPTVTPAVPLI